MSRNGSSVEGRKIPGRTPGNRPNLLELEKALGLSVLRIKRNLAAAETKLLAVRRELMELEAKLHV
ncbi:MAG: hypothetical protein V4641_22590, partial [Pseudomonadota bacterium]